MNPIAGGTMIHQSSWQVAIIASNTSWNIKIPYNQYAYRRQAMSNWSTEKYWLASQNFQAVSFDSIWEKNVIIPSKNADTCILLSEQLSCSETLDFSGWLCWTETTWNNNHKSNKVLHQYSTLIRHLPLDVLIIHENMRCPSVPSFSHIFNKK
jgi:hypothetical protein